MDCPLMLCWQSCRDLSPPVIDFASKQSTGQSLHYRSPWWLMDWRDDGRMMKVHIGKIKCLGNEWIIPLDKVPFIMERTSNKLVAATHVATERFKNLLWHWIISLEIRNRLGGFCIEGEVDMSHWHFFEYLCLKVEHVFSETF